MNRLQPTVALGVGVLWLGLASLAVDASAVRNRAVKDADQAKKDVETVQQHLKKSFPGKKWQSGPTQVDSKEIRAVFGAGRYYFVHSAPPLPPGARIQSLIDAYQKKVEDIRKNYLSLAVRIDPAGKITTFTTIKDFARALQPIKSAEEAKTTSAAVLALYGSGRVSPGAFPADKVTVTKTENGYRCTARPSRFFAGSTSFDKNGVLQRLSKQYVGPLPP